LPITLRRYVAPWTVGREIRLPEIPTSAHRRAAAAMIGLGIGFGVSQVLGFTPHAFDAGAYWAARPGALYQPDWGEVSGRAPFLYSPAFADVLEPLKGLPELVFTGLWQFLLFTILGLVLGVWGLIAVGAGFAAMLLGIHGVDVVLAEVGHGNIHVLLGAVALFGIRFPALWSFALLTKVTPGVGIVWFAARREWRNLAVVIAVTAAIAGVSFLARPDDWFDWVDLLRANANWVAPYWVFPVPLPIRLAMSVALIWWGARSDRPWVLPVAVAWAIPVAYIAILVVLVFAVMARRHGLAVTDRPTPQALAARTDGR
jgi:hypothetical protein